MADTSITPLPESVRKKIDGKIPTDEERKAEIDAYRRILGMIERTRDQFTKRVYVQTLEYTMTTQLR